MFLIVSTTVMGNKTSKWFNAWTTDIFEVLNSSQADLEPAISDGVITKVIPRIRYGKFNHPFTMAVFEKDGKESLVLICCGPNSDYDFKTSLALVGVHIKPQKRSGSGNKFYSRSFNDVTDEQVRLKLKSISEKEEEISPATTSRENNNQDDLNEKETDLSRTVGFADKVELTSEEVDQKFSKSDLIAYTLVNHFLNSSNLPFFNYDN